MEENKTIRFDIKARDDRFFRAAESVLKKYKITRRPALEEGFVVFDVSGSMSGSKIGTVNEAIRNVESMLADISESNADARIKVATLTFSTGAQWITEAPVEAEKFRWEDLDPAGITDLGEACRKLNDKLSRNGFMCDAAGSFAPAIFLMSDGEPTDDYARGLEKLKANNWFKKAIKVAIAIGNDANRKVLADFTGTDEAVITVHTPEELKKWIKFVSVRASEVGSKSANATTSFVGASDASDDPALGLESKQDLFVKEIQSEKKALDEQKQADPAPFGAASSPKTLSSDSLNAAPDAGSVAVDTSWDAFEGADNW